jgi:hypothetical protein
MRLQGSRVDERRISMMSDEHTIIGEHLIDEQVPATSQPDARRPDARTRINAVLREYVRMVQEVVWQDTFAVVRTVARPRVNFIRGKGWWLLCPETQQSRFVGASAEDVIAYLYARIDALRALTGE